MDLEDVCRKIKAEVRGFDWGFFKFEISDGELASLEPLEDTMNAARDDDRGVTPESAQAMRAVAAILNERERDILSALAGVPEDELAGASRINGIAAVVCTSPGERGHDMAVVLESVGSQESEIELVVPAQFTGILAGRICEDDVENTVSGD